MTDPLTRRAPRQPLLQVKTTLSDRFRIQTRDTRHPLDATVTDDLGKQSGHPAAVFLVQSLTDQLEMGFHRL
jgi:hypothetical protein